MAGRGWRGHGRDIVMVGHSLHPLEAASPTPFGLLSTGFVRKSQMGELCDLQGVPRPRMMSPALPPAPGKGLSQGRIITECG